MDGRVYPVKGPTNSHPETTERLHLIVVVSPQRFTTLSLLATFISITLHRAQKAVSLLSCFHHHKTHLLLLCFDSISQVYAWVTSGSSHRNAHVLMPFAASLLASNIGFPCFSLTMTTARKPMTPATATPRIARATITPVERDPSSPFVPSLS